MTEETYYGVVNDSLVGRKAELVPFCRTGGGDNYLFEDVEEALETRDQLIDHYDNPKINVYEVTVATDPILRDEVNKDR